MIIKGVIFDMDGLMIDTEKLLKRFWCQAANEFGYPMKEEHVLSIRSLAAKYAIPKLKGYFGEDFEYTVVRSRRMELMNQYIEENGVEKKPGLDKLLDYLKKEDIKIAVATATDEVRTKKYLEKIGIYHLFDSVICASMVENGKPAPDIYLKAAESLKFRPEQCLALEDSPNGILSAFRAGCIPVMVPDLDEPLQETVDILYKKTKELGEVISIVETLKKGNNNHLFQFRKKFLNKVEWSVAQKLEEKIEFKPEFYLKKVEEPEFGCEGRPDGWVSCVDISLQYENGQSKIAVEEKKFWESRWDEGMWFGLLKEEEYSTYISYQEKTRKIQKLTEMELELYHRLEEQILEEQKKYKYILFDLDGTLTDPKEGITKSFQYALKYMEIIEDNLNVLEKVIGPPLKDSFMEFYKMSEEEAAKAVLKYRERFEIIGLYENKIFDGIKEMLEHLQKQGFLLAVASSKPTVFVERICEYFEIKQYFHHIVGSFLDGSRVKKAEVVEEAIRQFEGAEAEEIIMVGDRKFDIEGAHQMGIKAVGVTFGYGGRKELEKAKADYIIETVKGLENLLSHMQKK